MSSTEKETGLNKHFELKFPNSSSLPYSYYEDTNYNDVRRCKLMLFSECIGSEEQLDMFRTQGDSISNRKNIVTKLLKNCGMYKMSINVVNNYTFEKIYTKERVVKHLERGCLNRAVEKSKLYDIRCVWSNEKFTNLYHEICYKVASNLDSNSMIESDYIKKKILDKQCKISDIANFTSTELYPEKYEKILNKINKRTNAEHKKKYSELYRCRKCKRNQTITERRYNRSLDEGVNLMIICTFCGFQWCG